jgi:hypothetical protein
MVHDISNEWGGAKDGHGIQERTKSEETVEAGQEVC